MATSAPLSPADTLNITATVTNTGAADGKTVVVRITNMGENPATTELVVPGFSGIAKPTTWTLQVSRRC